MSKSECHRITMLARFLSAAALALALGCGEHGSPVRPVAGGGATASPGDSPGGYGGSAWASPIADGPANTRDHGHDQGEAPVGAASAGGTMALGNGMANGTAGGAPHVETGGGVDADPTASSAGAMHDGDPSNGGPPAPGGAANADEGAASTLESGSGGQSARGGGLTETGTSPAGGNGSDAGGAPTASPGSSMAGEPGSGAATEIGGTIAAGGVGGTADASGAMGTGGTGVPTGSGGNAGNGAATGSGGVNATGGGAVTDPSGGGSAGHGGNGGGAAGAGAAPSCADLLVSEVQMAAESDANAEFVELFNRSATPLHPEGCSVRYRAAAGTKDMVIYEFGAGEAIPALGHYLLVREEASVGSAPDATFTRSIASAGGGVALVDAADNVIDSVGWGTATNDFVEGTAAAAPPAGSSIERLPGGSLGNGRDTDDNAADFAIVASPIPDNTGS
ncbi:MAG: lamin tail domain-containing protein [Polyangiaceae bacterium]|nr:lamin tail domain-containing protein [Polyangiaceae bacterium]